MSSICSSRHLSGLQDSDLIQLFPLIPYQASALLVICPGYNIVTWLTQFFSSTMSSICNSLNMSGLQDRDLVFTHLLSCSDTALSRVFTIYRRENRHIYILIQTEMQTATPKFRTCLPVSIYYHNKHYTTGVYYKNSRKEINFEVNFSFYKYKYVSLCKDRFII